MKKINPAICEMEQELNALRSFAQEVMECWPMGDLDGGSLQDAAEKHGLLKPEVRHEDCSDTNGNWCNCAGNCSPKEWKDGVVCYRKTKLLLGHNAKVSGG